ncbi:hypothetical protein [Shewanella putrefaciens]|uniref:Uncharacterized protein n=1 Tax=Shewanella putrefaciens (strain CN-32 / ATCC BAA-453) TaxID=319224 RepID=A4Y5F9_SHEPC|nr:hypothetical protein [Shewanella putrefaciens]QGS50365.1 hypothetical protein FOB89_16380 [Shewanella putrefaciens]
MRKILLPVIMLSLGALPLYAPAQGIADLLGKKYAEVKSSLLAAGWARVRTSTLIRTNTFGHFAKRVQSLNEVNNVNKENPQNTYR